MQRSGRVRKVGGALLATLVGGALVACQPPDGRDLAVAMDSPPTTLLVGEAAGFDVDVANVGEAAATGARLTLLVPLGIDASASIGGVDCVAEGVIPDFEVHALGCALGDVEVDDGRTVRVELVGDVAGVAGTITASASSTGGGEPQGGGAAHVVTVPISVAPLDRIDLEVTPAPSDTPPPVGTAFASRAVVVNRGTIPAEPVTVTQTFSSNMGVASPTLVRGDGATGTCSVTGQVATCTTGELTIDPLVDADDRWEMVVQATPTNGLRSEITYAATAPQPEVSPDPSPNTASSSLWAGLSWLTVDAPSEVAVGTTFDVPIVWSGSGIGQYLQAAIPSTLRLDGISGGLGGSIDCSGTGALSCSSPLFPFIASGSPVVATFTATDVGGPAPVGFFITSEAGSASGSVSVEVVDPTISSDVHARFDPTPFALIGSPVTIGGEVRTAGPTAHTGVVATVTAPPGSVVQGATWGALGLPCSLVGRVATCAIGDLDGHDQVPFEMVLTSYASGPATAVVAVASATAQDDPDPHPDQAQLTFPVRAPFVDLGASVEVADTTPLQGARFDAVFRVTNHGSETASNVVLEATIPSGWSHSSYGRGSGSNGTCTSLGGGRYRCTFPTVAGGSSGVLQVSIWAGPAGAVDLVANVAGAEADPVPDERPNEARVAVSPVGEHAELELTVNGPNPMVVGETRNVGATVRNHGPSRVPHAEVVVEIPAGWTIGTPTAGGGTCSTVVRTVTCTTGSITSGGTRSVSVPVTTSEVRADLVTATVTSAIPDPNPATDAAQTTISAVAPQVDLGIDEPSNSWFTFPNGGTFGGRQLRFTNHGNVPATDVVISGTLSPVGTFTEVRQYGTPTTVTCTWSGPSFSCTVPTLNPGSTRTLEFAASVPTTTGPLLLDVAISSAASELPAGQSNQRTVTMIASGQPIGIDGTVVGPGGAPIAGAVVRIYAPADGLAPTRRIDTAADGTWQARGLAPGTYRVSVTPPAGSGLVAEWYQDRPDRTSAHPLVIDTTTPHHVIVVQLA